MSINKKFTFWILSILALIGLCSSYLFYRHEVAEETRILVSIAGKTGPILEHSLDNYMLHRDVNALENTLQNIVGMDSIKLIRLINRDGIIKASTDKKEVGSKISAAEMGCHGCHDRGKGAFFFTTGEVFRYVQHIKNKPVCHECHDSRIKHNGVFVIEFPVTELMANLRTDVLIVFLIFLFSVTLLGLCMIFLSRSLVSRRLDKAVATVRKFKEGVFSARIPVEGNDEITNLSGAFNEMAETIQIRDAEKRRVEEELRRNYDTQHVINSLLRISLEDIPLEDILRQALDLILSISWLSVESRGAIFLTDDDTDSLVLKAQKGLSEYLQKECSHIAFGKCLCGRAALTREFTFADSLDDRHEISYEGITPHGHYCAPILFSGKALGVIGMYLREGHEQDEKEVEFLKAISNALAGIIQRKRIEKEQESLIAELQNTLSRVSRSQKMWLETFDSIGDMISIQDAEFNIIKCNSAFARYFGLEPKDVINRKCYDFFHASNYPVLPCPQKITLRENRPATVEILEERTNKIFLISTFPFSFHDAQFNGTIHIAKDITEDREKEMRLIMSERLVSLGQMASGIAHEINNPLAAIAGCAEGLLNRVRKGQFSPELFENYLQIIEEEILRCKNITGSMLSFVREKTYEKREVDINEALNKSLEIIGFQGRLKNVLLKKDFQAGLRLLQGNEGELRQVFLSLITNALDAMEDRGTLTIETGINNNAVVIKISDTGPGISPVHMKRIFDPFFTTKSDKGGTGLGLSIASKIISNHNGTIEVVSEKDRGTSFRILLPI
ncbi:MAG: GAF domain-containing protein [Nitrospirae bacterium]|nr:GAF domain-containing protein [Nitrospirota bacterium]